jgi:toxin ParE1/3/4
LKRWIHKSALAESDLLGIWQYTFESWGADQADEYLDELEQAISRLASIPEVGVSRELVRAGYRVLFVNDHAVYYNVASNPVRIVRVLHGRMDPDNHP